jgi:hypothetical protein
MDKKKRKAIAENEKKAKKNIKPRGLGWGTEE